uniref:Blue copper protein n=1 Tax=Zea mays TaxID=4577 RepID=B6TES1_MAIZE|nr:blue copper protein precursor [Zea mays]
MAATSRLALALLLAALVAAWQLPAAAVAANYTVGDEKGWNPDVDYTAWVKKHKPFYKGDWLIFEYQNGRSDVVQVDEVGYDNCDKANALSSYSKGHTYAFHLKDAKDYYFICSYGYCYNGMKLHVTAKSSSSSSSSSPSGSDSSSSSSDNDDDDSSSPSPPAKKSKAKTSAAPPPSVLAATPMATAAAAAALLLNRML